MQAANWNDVWNLFLSVFTHQTIVVQIAIGLIAALAALMIIEGLRASFFPQRRAEAIKPATMPQPVTIEPEPIQQAMPAAPMRSFAVTQPQRIARIPKRNAARPRTQKAPRPIIKRVTNVNYSEIAAE